MALYESSYSYPYYPNIRPEVEVNSDEKFDRVHAEIEDFAKRSTTHDGDENVLNNISQISQSVKEKYYANLKAKKDPGQMGFELFYPDHTSLTAYLARLYRDSTPVTSLTYDSTKVDIYESKLPIGGEYSYLRKVSRINGGIADRYFIVGRALGQKQIESASMI